VRLGQGCPIIQVVALSLPAAAHRCKPWQWLVVVSSAKQKQQLHHQQPNNGSTILKTFTFPEFLDLFKLIYRIYWIKFSKNILATVPAMGTYPPKSKNFFFIGKKKHGYQLSC
jgi:hypothetical protein